MQFQNKIGQEINGTLIHPKEPLPGNSCNQLFPGIKFSGLFIEQGISVFIFDFPGCGMSKEAYITFGCKEPHTIIDVSKSLHTHKNIGEIALFGHSMEGFSSLFATSLDSVFSSALMNSCKKYVKILKKKPHLIFWKLV